MLMSNSLPTIVRGTTYPITGYYTDKDGNTDITGSTIFFTMKPEQYDSSADDSTAVEPNGVKKTVTSFPDAVGGQYYIELVPDDTNTLTPGDYYYDIKIKLSTGKIYLLENGRVKTDGTPTNRQS